MRLAVLAVLLGAGAGVSDAQGVDPARIRDRIDADHPCVREIRGGYDATASIVYFRRSGLLAADGFTPDAEGARARETADRYTAFLFPRRGAKAPSTALAQQRQDPVFDTTPGSLDRNPLGLWRLSYVRFTNRAPETARGLEKLEEIRKRNGTDLDGTPMIRRVSEILELEALGFVARSAPPDGAANWAAWPLLREPRTGIPSDTFLAVVRRPDGAAADREIEQNFLCLSRTGEWCSPPMVKLAPFVQPLPIPARIGSHPIEPKPILHRFHPDLPASPAWGFDGVFPGPTIVSRGEESTGWYRDERRGFTARNIYHGLAGFRIGTSDADSGDENEAQPGALRLPSGPHDIPLLIADKEFDATLDHALAWDPFEMEGMLGAVDTVNGAVQPYLKVARRKYRFRLLNAGPARFYELHLSNSQTFLVIGSEGRLLEAPIAAESVRLAPTQRREIVVDFSTSPLGTEIVLENRLHQASGRGPSGRELTSAETRRVMKFIVDRDAPDPSRVPERLSEGEREEPGDLPRRRIVFESYRGSWTIDGKTFDPDRIDWRVKAGSREIWVLKNGAKDGVHAIDLGLRAPRILKRNGRPPEPLETAPTDLVEVRAGDEVEVYLRFPKLEGRRVLRCANAAHEDHGEAAAWAVDP